MTLNEVPEQDGSRFQAELAEFIKANGLKTIVETGYGISSIFILKAIEQTGGKLYSIDPQPWNPNIIEHEQLVLIEDKSQDALLPLAINSGAWDFFLHDGNHDILCQTLEYNFAWGCLREGGWLASDDTNWGNNGAWEKFCKENNLTSIKLGSLDMVQKNTPPKDNIYQHFENCQMKAQLAENEYLANGGQLTPIFQ